MRGFVVGELLNSSVQEHRREYDLEEWSYTFGVGTIAEHHVTSLRRGLLAGTIEVKSWRTRYETVYVELSCYSRRSGEYVPSGLNVTTADAWCFVGMDNDDNVVSSFVVPTDRLRKLAAERPVVEACANSANPTRGLVLSVSELLRSA